VLHATRFKKTGVLNGTTVQLAGTWVLREKSPTLAWNQKIKLWTMNFLSTLVDSQVPACVSSFPGNLNYQISNRRITKPIAPREKNIHRRETCSCKGRAKEVRIFCAEDSRDIGWSGGEISNIQHTRNVTYANFQDRKIPYIKILSVEKNKAPQMVGRHFGTKKNTYYKSWKNVRIEMWRGTILF